MLVLPQDINIIEDLSDMRYCGFVLCFGDDKMEGLSRLRAMGELNVDIGT
jgi:hypothetical protein